MSSLLFLAFRTLPSFVIRFDHRVGARRATRSGFVAITGASSRQDAAALIFVVLFLAHSRRTTRRAVARLFDDEGKMSRYYEGGN